MRQKIISLRSGRPSLKVEDKMVGWTYRCHRQLRAAWEGYQAVCTTCYGLRVACRLYSDGNRFALQSDTIKFCKDCIHDELDQIHR